MVSEGKTEERQGDPLPWREENAVRKYTPSSLFPCMSGNGNGRYGLSQSSAYSLFPSLTQAQRPAEIIRDIFTWTMQGDSALAIVKRLTEKNINPPKAYPPQNTFPFSRFSGRMIFSFKAFRLLCRSFLALKRKISIRRKPIRIQGSFSGRKRNAATGMSLR